MKTLKLNQDSVTVLQIIDEKGKEDLHSLAESVHFSRNYLSHILQNLKRKGLIKMQGSWIYLSAKGKKTIRMVWPEIPYIRYS